MNIQKIPFGGKHLWVQVREAAAAAGLTAPELENRARGVGARIVYHDGRDWVDFSVLGASACWKQLLLNNKSTQERLDIVW